MNLGTSFLGSFFGLAVFLTTFRVFRAEPSICKWRGWGTYKGYLHITAVNYFRVDLCSDHRILSLDRAINYNQSFARGWVNPYCDETHIVSITWLPLLCNIWVILKQVQGTLKYSDKTISINKTVHDRRFSTVLQQNTQQVEVSTMNTVPPLSHLVKEKQTTQVRKQNTNWFTLSVSRNPLLIFSITFSFFLIRTTPNLSNASMPTELL